MHNASNYCIICNSTLQCQSAAVCTVPGCSKIKLECSIIIIKAFAIIGGSYYLHTNLAVSIQPSNKAVPRDYLAMYSLVRKAQKHLVLHLAL